MTNLLTYGDRRSKHQHKLRAIVKRVNPVYGLTLPDTVTHMKGLSFECRSTETTIILESGASSTCTTTIRNIVKQGDSRNGYCMIGISLPTNTVQPFIGCYFTTRTIGTTILLESGAKLS